MDTTKSSVPAPPHEAPEEAPCACYDGLVFIGCLVEDLESGEEVEVETAYPCHRCSAGEPR